jgi:hypothetical protein
MKHIIKLFLVTFSICYIGNIKVDKRVYYTILYLTFYCTQVMLKISHHVNTVFYKANKSRKKCLATRASPSWLMFLEFSQKFDNKCSNFNQIKCLKWSSTHQLSVI